MSLLNHPMVTNENWNNFTDTDHATWKFLFKRQEKLLQNRATPEIIEGMKKLDICNDKIPKFSQINKILQKETGFSVIPVTGLIPADLFFKFLAERKFPSTCFIRKPEQMDYLEEPDIFHDVFGHVPLLVNHIFADFMEEFGQKGLESIEKGCLDFIAALYWFTVEFGLINTPNGTRIYGAGITSSKGESIYSLDSDIPSRLKFDAKKAMNSKYHVDAFQKNYFVIDSFDEIFSALKNLDWNQLKINAQLNLSITL